MRGIKVLALAGLATKQNTRWFQLQHNARRKKVFEPGMEKQMWKEREKGKKEKPSASVRAEESGGEKWLANVKNRDKKPLAGTKPLLLTSVRQSLSPRAPSLWSHLALLLSPRGHGHIPGQGFAGCWGHCPGPQPQRCPRGRWQ